MKIIDENGYRIDYACGSSVIYNPGSGRWEAYKGRSIVPRSTHESREAAIAAVGTP